MRFLADENIPKQAVELLRQAGHDVAWIPVDCAGVDDLQVMDRAIAEQRIILTFDKDFGELVFREGAARVDGVILLRFIPESPQQLALDIHRIITSRSDWSGHFSVVDSRQVRMRRLPGRGHQ